MSLIAEIKKTILLAPWIAAYTNGLRPASPKNPLKSGFLVRKPAEWPGLGGDNEFRHA